MIQVGSGILYPALRKAGVTLGPGRGPSPAQYRDSLDELNRLMGSLNCDRLFIYAIDEAQYPLTDSKASYTIGDSTSDFNGPRPQLIEAANIFAGTIPYRLALPDTAAWARMARIPFSGGTIPTTLYNDRAFPVSRLWLWPPPAAGLMLELYTWHQIPAVTAVTDGVTLPAQYFDALVLNLAVRLAPHFQRPLDPIVMQQARESLMRLESINAPQPVLEIPWSCGCSGSGGSDWFVAGGGGGGGGSTSVNWTRSSTVPDGIKTGFAFDSAPQWVSWNGVNQFRDIGYHQAIAGGVYVITFIDAGGHTLTPQPGDDIRGEMV